MATHQVDALGGPNPSGGGAGAVFPEPYAIKATNDKWNPLVWVFNDTATKDGLHARFVVPQDYVGSPVFIPVWTATVTSGNVALELQYRAVGGDDAESLDQSTAQETLTVTDAAPSAAHERNTPSMSATAANIAAGDLVELILFRDGTSGSDTMASALILFGLIFQYADV